MQAISNWINRVHKAAWVWRAKAVVLPMTSVNSLRYHAFLIFQTESRKCLNSGGRLKNYNSTSWKIGCSIQSEMQYSAIASIEIRWTNAHLSGGRGFKAAISWSFLRVGMKASVSTLNLRSHFSMSHVLQIQCVIFSNVLLLLFASIQIFTSALCSHHLPFILLPRERVYHASIKQKAKSKFFAF